jgi:hypothetical protein
VLRLWCEELVCERGVRFETDQFDAKVQCLASPNIGARRTNASTARHPIDSISCIRPSLPIADFGWVSYTGRNHANKADIAVIA